MNKELKTIIYQIIICIFCFLTNWYGDTIAEYFTPFPVIFLRLFLIIVFVKLSYSIIRYFKFTKNKFKIINVFFIVMTIFVNFYSFRLMKTKLELWLFEDERNEIIEKVKNNELKYYYGGNIKLPNYKYVSSDGEIYVYQNDDEHVIGFWIFRGLLSGSIQLIYSSSDEKLIYENKSSIIKIIKLKDHWYYVETDY